MDYLFDPEELGEGVRFIPETGRVEVSFNFTVEQKAVFDELGEKLAELWGRAVTPEEVMLYACKHQLPPDFGKEHLSLN